MNERTKVATIVIGWLVGVVASIVLGFLVHSAFFGVAAGAIVTVVLLRYAVEWAGKQIAQRASDRTDRMLEELEEMKEEVDAQG